MTAGRGILHAEMPNGDGDQVGLQLWINLKSKDKVKAWRITNKPITFNIHCVLLNEIFVPFLQMVEPAYQELVSKDIPHVTKDGVHVIVIAGEALGASVSHWSLLGTPP